VNTRELEFTVGSHSEACIDVLLRALDIDVVESRFYLLRYTYATVAISPVYGSVTSSDRQQSVQ
jgi:hypothetical protein